MSKSVYDTIIVGLGAAGEMAAAKLATSNTNKKILVIEAGSPFLKRRSQIIGSGGCTMFSDGKLYANDLKYLEKLVGIRKAKSALKWFKGFTEDLFNIDMQKDKSPSATTVKNIKKLGFDIETNSYAQLIPANFHNLSKKLVETYDKNQNIEFIYDKEVLTVSKSKNVFSVVTEGGDTFYCKRLVLSSGRASWRWVSEIYKQFNIVKENNYARFGIRVELPEECMEHFNKSHCSLSKKEYSVEKISWNSTMVPEDHGNVAAGDIVISNCRSGENEQRWANNKTSFNLLGNIKFENKGVEQTNRIAQLSFILSNERISKEKISTLLNSKSKLSVIPEYNWLIDSVKELSKIIPDISNKGYYYFPTICPLPIKVNMTRNLQTDITGLYVCGENSGQIGILYAMLSGIIVADALLQMNK